jgi:hypothetical protein
MKLCFKMTNMVITALFISLSINQLKAQAQVNPNSNNQPKTIHYKHPQTSNNGQPRGNNQGAGSSGSLCQFPETEHNPKIKRLTALVPATEINVIVQGNTTVTNPTFFFYVAYPINSYAELLIQDDQGTELYLSPMFELGERPGIVSVTIPQILEIGKYYRWYFRIRCDQENTPDDFVSGRLLRVPELSVDLLQGKTALEKAIIYANYSLWFDALNELAELKNQQPNNKMVTEIWRDLLTQVGFAQLADQSIVQRQIFEK